MRLTIFSFIVVSIAFAKTPRAWDVNGVWIAGLAKCDIGSASCNRVILDVTTDGDRLKVIEVTSDGVGESVAQRQYLFKGRFQHVDRGVGIAKVAGRRAVLRSSEHLERWSTSEDGSLLVVNRWSGVDPKGPQQVLFFRRSERTVD